MQKNHHQKLFVLLSFILPCFAFAEDKPVRASDVCMASAKAWAIKSEAKQKGGKAEKIKATETNQLGNGANLFLVSVFVEGPNTGENTHWEVVGEFNYKTDVCKIIIGRRYWAH